jgi:hypothetical protein
MSPVTSRSYYKSGSPTRELPESYNSAVNE